MKKLTLNEDVLIKEVIAHCSYCNEVSSCFRSNYLNTVEYKVPIKETRKVFDDFNYSFSGKKIIKGDYRYEFVVTEEKTVEKSEFVDICHSCVDQLSKLIKK